MVLQVRTGSFTKIASPAIPTDQTITDVGFEPKVIIFYSGSLTTTGDDHRNSIGFAEKTGGTITQRAVGWSVGDDVNPTNAGRVDSDQHCFRQISEGGAEHCSLQCTSMSAASNGSFTVTYTAGNTATYPILYQVYGGADITNTRIGTITTPVATGNQDTTWASGWTPDIVFFLTTGASATANTFAAGARVGWGAAASNARRATITTASRDALTATDSGRKSNAQKAIHLMQVDTNVTSLVLEADYGIDIATGFRLNYTTVPSTQIPLFYLAIKGGSWDVGTFNSATATGNQAVTTTFQPKGIMLYSNQVSADNTIGTHSVMGFGSGSSTTDMNTFWYQDTDNSSPSVAARSSSTSAIVRHLVANAIGANSTVDRQATIQSFNSTNFTLNWSVVTAGVAVQIHAIIAGDTVTAPTTVTKGPVIIKYSNNILVNKTAIVKYSMGGLVDVPIIQHSYDILGQISTTVEIVYSIQGKVSKTVVIKYGIANVTLSPVIFKYDIESVVSTSVSFVYDIAEHPSLNLRRYAKPLGLRVFIMSHDMRETFHVFNSFNLEESTIHINSASVNLSINDAGDFSIEVEDSRHGIDTSLVGEGNAILIQAAKTVEDLGDGRHNLLLGYITEKKVSRPDTNVLVYTFNGYGSMIRFNERLTNFSKSARRIKHDSPEPDTTDPDMIAYRLFQSILDTTDHMPIGGPKESQFTFTGVTDVLPRVEGFIASIDEQLAEMSSPMNTIADASGASWGVSYNPNLNDVFLRYATLEPSGIIIKSGNEIENPDDDKFKTAYIQGDWSFTDSRDKSQGFTNRFIARVGTKDVTANVLEIQGIIDQFTSLAVNDPPIEGGGVSAEGRKAAFGPIIYLRSDIVGPFSGVWSAIANYAREFNMNITYLVMKLGTGSDGPGPDIGQPDWVQPWNELNAAGVRMLGFVNTEFATRTEAAVKAEIDRWVTTWGPHGIFFERVSTNPSHHAYYQNLASYAKSLGLLSIVAHASHGAFAPESLFVQCPDLNIIVTSAWSAGDFPTHEQITQPWYPNISPSRRAHILTGVTPAIASDDDVAQWVSDLEFYNTGSYFYITDDGNPEPFDTFSGRFRASMFGAEQAAIRILQDSGFIVPGVPVQQDLAMSFTAQTQNLTDIAVIVSKIGNPIPDADEEAGQLFIEILSDRQVTKTEENPQTGEITTTIVNMPSFSEPVAHAAIPFTRITDQFPTVIFLHDFVQRHQDISVGSRYWVVMYGRGQNEENTIRWHHANNNEVFDYLAARRVPAAIRKRSETQRQQWQVFTKTTHPGFALSFFRNTTHMLEASDSDSIDRFGLVESELDMTGIDDDAMTIKAMHAIIHYSAKPKRLYDIRAVTAPDDLILPGMLVRIYDDMTLSGQVAGSTAEGTEAEILASTYDFNADSSPMGCRYIEIEAIGHVDFAWAYWKAKYDRGDVTVDFPDIVPKPPGPLPDRNGPVVLARPKGGTFNTALTVLFTVNKSNVNVFYTLNGTTPVVTGAGTPSSENDTRLYIPGSSAPIPINNTTTIKFRGIDAEGNQSTVYTEEYTIGVPTPPGGGKVLSMPYWKGATLSTIQSTFNASMNANLDYVTYHKRIQETYDTSWANATLATHGKLHEVEFEGYDDMVNHIDTAKTAGFDIIGYNGEEDNSYPDADQKDVVATHKKFSDYVKNKGLKVRFNPSPHYTKTYGSRIVKYCDYYNIQGHKLQGETQPFRDWVRQSADSLRANNSNVMITVGLSADTVQHKSVKGQTRLQTLQNRWTYAKSFVDGVRVFYKTDSELTSIVQPFLQWFGPNGRNV